MILLREPRVRDRALFERNLSVIAENLGYGVEWFQPEEGGRGETFRRDYGLVETADWVECFFHPDTPMGGGTGHVVDAAMARDIPVYAWTMDERGDLERIGEFEPDD